MKNRLFYPFFLSAWLFLIPVCDANNAQHVAPEAGGRNYSQNFKDMVLAICVANAYKSDKNAAIDAGSSASALRDWAYYDMEKAPDIITKLVDGYLTRNYHNPLVESEVKDVRFDFLKCLDLYHSHELEKQARLLVINPDHSYRTDTPQVNKPQKR